MAEIQPTSSNRIVVVGGGFAGLSAALTARRLLPATDGVTLIAPEERFVFAPTLIWTVMGEPSDDETLDIAEVLHGHDVNFIRARVQHIDLERRVAITPDTEVPFTRLIVATGGRPNAARIPGLAGELRSCSWVVGEDSAMEARNAVRQLIESPGPIIIGAAQGASYISAAYELALSLDLALREAGVRDRAPITFVTAEPYLGHLGIGQEAARPLLEELFSERGIRRHTGVEIERVQRDGVKVSGHEILPAEWSLIMPPFTGAVAVWKSAGLTDSTGLIPITPTYRHISHPDVFAAGVAAYFASPVPPLGELHAPHTGYLSLDMGRRAAQSAAASLGHGSPPEHTLPLIVDARVLDGGDTGMVLTSRGREHLTHSARFVDGNEARSLKESSRRQTLQQLQEGLITT